MAREKLTCIIGRVEDFEAIGFTITTERKSLDGSLVLMHKEDLEAWMLNAVSVDILQNQSPFVYYDDEDLAKLMATAEWTAEEV